jgi:hypothetical protein
MKISLTANNNNVVGRIRFFILYFNPIILLRDKRKEEEEEEVEGEKEREKNE